MDCRIISIEIEQNTQTTPNKTKRNYDCNLWVDTVGRNNIRSTTAPDPLEMIVAAAARTEACGDTGSRSQHRPLDRQHTEQPCGDGSADGALALRKNTEQGAQHVVVADCSILLTEPGDLSQLSTVNTLPMTASNKIPEEEEEGLRIVCTENENMTVAEDKGTCTDDTTSDSSSSSSSSCCGEIYSERMDESSATRDVEIQRMEGNETDASIGTAAQCYHDQSISVSSSQLSIYCDEEIAQLVKGHEDNMQEDICLVEEHVQQDEKDTEGNVQQETSLDDRVVQLAAEHFSAEASDSKSEATSIDDTAEEGDKGRTAQGGEQTIRIPDVELLSHAAEESGEQTVTTRLPQDEASGSVIMRSRDVISVENSIQDNAAHSIPCNEEEEDDDANQRVSPTFVPVVSTTKDAPVVGSVSCNSSSSKGSGSNEENSIDSGTTALYSNVAPEIGSLSPVATKLSSTGDEVSADDDSPVPTEIYIHLEVIDPVVSSFMVSTPCMAIDTPTCSAAFPKFMLARRLFGGRRKGSKSSSGGGAAPPEQAILPKSSRRRRPLLRPKDDVSVLIHIDEERLAL
jgi:hypothetical protein